MVAAMELRHLRYFLAVAEEQNVSRAALRLHISQPALSRQIKDLETELGTALFERSANLVRLTDAGKIFQHDCRLILRRVDDAVEKVKQGKQQQVRIGYASSPTSEILPRALALFQKSHPDIAYSLHDMTSRGLLNSVRDNKIDVALTVSVAPGDFAGLGVEQIGAYEMHVAVPKGHRFEKLKKVPLADIAREPHVTWTRDEHPEGYSVLKKILSPYIDAPNISIECDGAPSLITAVESGKGVALVFETLAKIAGKRLVLRPITPSIPLLPISIIYDEGRLTPAGKNFVTAVRAAQRKPKGKRAVVAV
ncbi:MAG: hypothetical protein K0R10_1771 [Alphaproteobacteria bacterium]|jgi:DNA-binding transcriptional LysR family regulator|nr:hypothetical protein [Alphaproteobacteria bacterium]